MLHSSITTFSLLIIFKLPIVAYHIPESRIHAPCKPWFDFPIHIFCMHQYILKRILHYIAASYSSSSSHANKYRSPSSLHPINEIMVCSITSFSLPFQLPALCSRNQDELLASPSSHFIIPPYTKMEAFMEGVYLTYIFPIFHHVLGFVSKCVELLLRRQ